MVTMVTAMVVRLRKRRTGKQQNHGEQQDLFHDQMIATTACPVSGKQVNFRVTCSGREQQFL
jgi:hypothetical protein